jgi:hypothetical protein
MYVIRDIMHCKPGQVKPMVEKFRQLSKALKKKGYKPFRLMTDVSGQKFWTVVAEQDVKSLDEYNEAIQSTMGDKNIQKIMKGYHDLVESGEREIYTLAD